MSYFDEGLNNFQTFAGNGPGISQTLTLPPFAPGSLTLPTAAGVPRSPVSFTPPFRGRLHVRRGHATIDPNLRTPYVQLDVGYQREIGATRRRSALRRQPLDRWRGYNINETNIFENGFLKEFRNAQRNLEINRTAASASPTRPAGTGGAADVRRGVRPARHPGGGATGSGYQHHLRAVPAAGRGGPNGESLAGDFRYLCAMVGNHMPGCTRRGYNASGPTDNVFQMNPFRAGETADPDG